MNRQFWTTLMLTSMVFVACGSDPEPVNTEAMCERTLEAFCARATECGVPTNCGDGREREEDLMECKSDAAAGVAAGSVSFDGDAITACVDGSRSATCHQLISGWQPNACYSMARGRLKAEAVCGSDLECESGSCENKTCMPLLEKGQVCGAGMPGCRDALVCASGHCVEALGIGQTCTPDHKDPPDCERGLLCDADTRKCRGPLKEGDSCELEAQVQCEWGQGCQGERGTMTCRPLIAPGMSCAGITYPRCVSGYRCLDGVCARSLADY